MKSIAIVCLFVAGAAANYGYSAPAVVRVADTYSSVMDLPSYGAPVLLKSHPFVPILRFDQEIRGGLSDSTVFETGNGIHVSDNTQVVAGRGLAYDDGYGSMIASDSSLIKSGNFAYTSPEGIPIALSWTADEGGFHAVGSHLPTPPPQLPEYAELLRTANYGYAAPVEAVRVASYDAPAIRMSSYDAPAIRVSSYDAPAVAVRVADCDTPAIRVSSYDAPAIRVSSYDAPAVRVASTYDTPAIRVSTY